MGIQSQAVIKKLDRKQLLQSCYKNVTGVHYKVLQVLQSVTDCYNKVRQALQSATVITNWEATVWSRANWEFWEAKINYFGIVLSYFGLF